MRRFDLPQRTCDFGSREKAMALIIVLALLVLLSAIVVALLTTVTTDVAASKTYQNGVNARLLADSAVNLVIGQIREASTTSGNAWISQPGLLRTFKDTGTPLQAYKLYSSDQLIVDAASFDPNNNPGDVPAIDDWRKQSALWVNLNAPVSDPTRRDANGKPLLTYPILDGNHLRLGTDPANPGPVGQLFLTPPQTGSASPDIAGFEVLKFDSAHPVEMPVKWLYILKDGTIVPAGAGSSLQSAKLVIPAGKERTPEKELNEPVARIAFWTDDESGKINLNTASEGTFWDTPICNSQRDQLLPKPPPPGVVNPDLMYEMDLAEYMPGQHEYQRYPGHPATTSLSPVFGQRLSLIKPNRWDMIETIYEMVPRIVGHNYDSGNPANPYGNGAPGSYTDYSSDGGTRRAGKGVQLAGDDSVWPVTLDHDRLYASVDELLFNPVFANNQRGGQLLAVKSKTDQTDLSREMLETARFFLTTESRAPEQNLFNKPRVALWPVNVDDAKRTTFDRTIAFCATVGPRSNPSAQLPFIFTREDPTSPIRDYSHRNAAIYAYLHNLMAARFPGYPLAGAAKTTFADKYGGDSDQILTEIYDYIRCTNLIDRSEGDAKSYTPVAQDVNTQLTKRGQVVPIKIGSTQGFGRIATVSELALAFVRFPDTAAPANSIKLEAALLPQLFCPMAGFSALANDIRLNFSKIDITVTDSTGASYRPFDLPGGKAQPDLYDVGRITDIEDNESKIGGYIGARSLFEGNSGGRYPINVGSPRDSVPPTGEFSIPNSATSLSFQGYARIDIYAPHDSGNLVQTLVFHFGSPTLPVQVPIPSVAPDSPPFFANGPGGRTQGNRCAGQYNDIFKSQDVVRSSTSAHGDLRLSAASALVEFLPSTGTPFFDLRGSLIGSTAHLSHSMRPCWNSVYSGFTCGSLVSGLTSYSSSGGSDIRPPIPPGVNGVLNASGQPGDWDNGQGFILDGPYCNKADEGGRRHEHGRSQAGGQYDEDSSPYIGWYWNPQDSITEQVTFFSPNRQIASPVTFGSLPTGVLRGRPWQTLLFRPAKSYFPGGIAHPGGAQAGPPDHLLLDLFWMPIVEPYPISEPFATAGKINLNCQIVPFTNIKRNTGLRAVMQAVKVAALNPNQPELNGSTFIKDYKLCGSGVPGDHGVGGGHNVIVRRNIDIDNTLRQIEDRFAKNKPFISASEICDIPLIPADLSGHVSAGITSSTPLNSFDGFLANFWRQNSLTGDNTLERPYSYLYPRLTTRSNTYTVHVHVQTLKQTPRSTQTDEFIDGRDVVTGDFRGSFVIERYLDPNSAGFYKTDEIGQQVATTEADPSGFLGPYRFRVISSKQFAP